VLICTHTHRQTVSTRCACCGERGALQKLSAGCRAGVCSEPVQLCNSQRNTAARCRAQSQGCRPSAHLLVLPGGVEVQHDEVAVCHVEPRQVVHRHLGVVDVLIHDIGGAARVLCGAPADAGRHKTLTLASAPAATPAPLKTLPHSVGTHHTASAAAGANTGIRGAQPDLPHSPKLAEDVIHLVRRDVERQVAHVQYPATASRPRVRRPGAGRHALLSVQARHMAPCHALKTQQNARQNARLVTSGGSLWLRLRTAAEAILLKCQVRASSPSVCLLQGGVPGRSKRGSSRATWCRQPLQMSCPSGHALLGTAQCALLSRSMLVCELPRHSGVLCSSKLRGNPSSLLRLMRACMTSPMWGVIRHCARPEAAAGRAKRVCSSRQWPYQDKAHFGSA